MKKTKSKTKKERRIEILKDVLKQLNAEKYTAISGSYVILPKEIRLKEAKNPTGSAQAALKTCEKSCKVCAKGSIFLSTVRKENKVELQNLDWDNYDPDNKGATRVINLFGRANLNKIEAAFEKWIYKYNDDVEYSQTEVKSYFGEVKTALDLNLQTFVKAYPKKKDRLEAIIKNCIKNDGIFKP